MNDSPPIDVTPEQWAIVRAIVREHVPDHEVRAFGSRATWTAKPYSDLDLVVISDDPLPTDIMAAMRESFVESDLPWKVDVVDWAELSQAFKDVVRCTAEPVQRTSWSRAGS